MKALIQYNSKHFSCDLSKPLDLSIPIGKVNCFHAPHVVKRPFESDNFIGSVKEGAPVNFFNYSFNPHGNGTHTESLGHITQEQESISDCLKEYHFIGTLISLTPEEINGDWVVTRKSLEEKLKNTSSEALIIRTLPNNFDKLSQDYSGTNPPYLSNEAMEYIHQLNIKHLLVDLPSVDREEDGGKLINHRTFWQVKGNQADHHSQKNKTITELIFVPNKVIDGLYLLNIQLPSIHLDAAPSKPVLYQLKETV